MYTDTYPSEGPPCTHAGTHASGYAACTPTPVPHNQDNSSEYHIQIIYTDHLHCLHTPTLLESLKVPRVENLRGSSRGSQAGHSVILFGSFRQVQYVKLCVLSSSHDWCQLGTTWEWFKSVSLQGRSESNHSWTHDFRDPIRSVNRREET